MERESNPMEALCRSGCGFYGNPSTDGLCSVCFKEALKKKQQPPAPAPAVSSSFVAGAAPMPAPSPLAAATPTVPAHTVHSAHTSPAHNQNVVYYTPKKTVKIMDNDPSKKESKGKRLLRKALRRGSKSRTSSQSSALDLNKSNSATELNNSTILPNEAISDQPVYSGTTSELKLDHASLELDKSLLTSNQVEDPNVKKFVSIQEENVAKTGSMINTARRTSPFDKISEHPEHASSSKKNLKRKAEEDSASDAAAGTSADADADADIDGDDKEDPAKDKKKKNRCAVCRKKVGLTGFECRCGGLFCAVHRYSDKHDCSFDYREFGAQEIRKNNPVVVSQKIHKI